MKILQTMCLALLLALVGLAPTALAQLDKKDKRTLEGFKALTHDDPTVRYQFADLLAQLGPVAKSALPALREALLKDKSIAVRVKIAEALWKIEQPATTDVLPTLLQALKDKEPDNRMAAALLLGQIGPAAKKAVPALSKALSDEDLGVRNEVAGALGEIGPAASSAIPALLAATAQKDFDFIEPVIAIALGKMGSAAVPALTYALTDKNVKLRRTAVTALGLLGPQARAAVPALTLALTDSAPDVRQYAVQALGQIGPGAKAALEKIKPGLKDKNHAVRVSTSLALWQIDKQTDGIAVLTEVLQEKSSYVRERAARALGEIGPTASSALPHLVPALEDKDARLRAAAAEALGRLKAGKADAARLLPLLEDADVHVRVNAAQSLWMLAPAVRGKALPVLTKELEHKYAQVRIRVATILGAFGSDAREAVPALQQAMLEQIPQVRLAIEEALKKIDPKTAAKMGIR